MKTATPDLRAITPNPTTSETPPPAAAPADPFDLENLRLDSNFAATAGVKKLLRTVPVRKPTNKNLSASTRTRPSRKTSR